MGEVKVFDTDGDIIIIEVVIPMEKIRVALEEAGFLTSDENISTIAEAEINKLETDFADDLQEFDFLVECMADDLEPDPDNEKAYRDWRMRQGQDA